MEPSRRYAIPQRGNRGRKQFWKALHMPSFVRHTYDIRGTVQGVGFRPTVYRLATSLGLGGTIQNRAGTVRLVLEGDGPSLDQFMAALSSQLPVQAHIESCTLVEAIRLGDSRRAAEFSVIPPDGEEKAAILIPPDLATCAACMEEVRDPLNRRHGYPFTTCTDCGPRYTVLQGMPYDRRFTTLSAFPLCEACRSEYIDPSNRRFHAETMACPACGPQLQLADADCRPIHGSALQGARRILADGGILAVRGIGGFLLAVNARHRDSLAALRRRKERPHKPLAVMARDLPTVAAQCEVPAPAAEALQSAEAPIVILDVLKEAQAAGALPLDLLTPDARTLGVMLPTSALHWLLLAPLPGDPVPAFDWLVMTSGNRRGEPICLTNEEASLRLRGIADAFLFHNREIRLRNDDSLCAIQRDRPQVWRRARGYAPGPVRSPVRLARCCLAMGAEMKNAVALGFEDRVVLSPHIGDLDTPEATEGQRTVAEALPLFLQRSPDAVAVDLHPDMHSSRLGATIASRAGLPLITVQHHHAHALACLAENGRSEGLALVFDGTGLGPDGTIWGAELLHVETGAFKRLASFMPAPLPGGDAAIRRPARQAVARLWASGIPLLPERLRALGVTEEEAAAWIRQCETGLHCPMTHGAGRLFDSLSALLGLCPPTATYDGQAAIRLEAAAREAGEGAPQAALPYLKRERDCMLWIDWSPAFVRLAELPVAGNDAPRHALAAHRGIAEAARDMIEYGLSATGSQCVALSGGVFMNRVLTTMLSAQLESAGIRVLLHRDVPPNDGCIALGQAIAGGIGE